MQPLSAPRELLVLKAPLQRSIPLGLEGSPDRLRLLYFARPEDLLSAIERRMGDAVLASLTDLGSAADALIFCKRVKAGARGADLPLLLLGEFRDRDTAVRLLEAGADELLPEDVDSEWAVARVEVWLRAKARLDDLSRAKKRVVEAAELDALTGTGNRAAFDRRLAEVAFGDRRRGRGVSLLLIDVDHFKPINDRHGHRFGDYVLAEVAALLRERFRETDFVARYGGDEFAVLAEGSDARVLARSLLRLVRERRFEHEGRRAAVTLSIGIAGTDAPEVDSPAKLVEAADRALYRAKAAGRDRAEVWRGPEPSAVLDARDLDALQARTRSEAGLGTPLS